MKLKLIATSLLLAQLALASGKEIKVTVNGMVCSFCAQGITKRFKTEPTIDSVDVKLSEKRVTLKTKENQDLSDSRIKEIFGDSGYNVDKIDRK